MFLQLAQMEIVYAVYYNSTVKYLENIYFSMQNYSFYILFVIYKIGRSHSYYTFLIIFIRIFTLITISVKY